MRVRKKRYNSLEGLQSPVRSEQDFRNGITFDVKLIGDDNVARPTSRIEIVLFMRKIKLECKEKKLKSRKVILEISFDGIKVTEPRPKKKDTQPGPSIAHHPINRIFYVSHDSLDLHIFSYIAREGNFFKCLVFKAPKQFIAFNVVNTIGQAFDLCNELDVGDKVPQQPQQQTIAKEADCSAANEQQQQSSYEEIKQQERPDSITANISVNIQESMSTLNTKLDNLVDKVSSLETQINALVENLQLSSRAKCIGQGQTFATYSSQSNYSDLQQPQQPIGSAFLFDNI